MLLWVSYESVASGPLLLNTLVQPILTGPSTLTFSRESFQTSLSPSQDEINTLKVHLILAGSELWGGGEQSICVVSDADGVLNKTAC